MRSLGTIAALFLVALLVPGSTRAEEVACATTLARAESIPVGTRILVKTYANGAEGKEEWEALHEAEDPTEFYQLVGLAIFWYALENHFVFDTCGPCNNPQQCQRHISGEAELFSAPAYRLNPDGTGEGAIILAANYEIYLNCTACAMPPR